MAPCVAMLLGRTVWTRDSGRWSAEAFPAGPAREPIARLAEILAAAPTRRAAVIFEPESLSHQSVETPKVSRAGFASLARVRRDHPVVEAEDLGWGIETPEASAGGSYATLIHAELTPGLVLIRDACAEARCPFSGAWPVHTVAAALARSQKGRPVRWVLLLTPGYVAVSALGSGPRSFRSWTGTLTERDGKTLSGILGDAEGGLAPIGVGTARRGGVMAVVAGEPDRVFPGWAELRDSGRVEAVFDLDALALEAARLPRRHPSNLLGAFPNPRSLDPLLAGAALVGCAAAFGFGSLILGDRSRLSALDAAHQQRMAELEAQVAHLEANRRAMLSLEDEVPEGFGPLPMEMKAALLRLASAIPDSLTLSSFVIGIDRSFALDAFVVGRGFDDQGARQALERSGFVPGKDLGWSFEPSSGRLRVQGRFNEIGL